MKNLKNFVARDFQPCNVNPPKNAGRNRYNRSLKLRSKLF